VKRYVALGSPLAAMRSQRNYPHLLAADLSLDLVDVSYSGATTAHLLTDRQNGAPRRERVRDLSPMRGCCSWST
jgi:hypothetical protein